MEKLLWVFSLLGLWALANGATPSATAPSPSVDCSSVLLSMADCLSFVMNGSTVSKPQGSCCSGFKMVLKQSPKCLCEAFKNNNNLGIALNMTKATALPSACGVSTPPLSNCAKINGAPIGAPGPSPSPSAAPGSSSIPSTGGSAAATAPSPSQSGAAVISTSVAVLALSLAIVICSYF